MKISYFITGALLTAAFTAPSQAEAAANGNIEGYYRIQSAAGVAENTGYVELRGPLSAYPNASWQTARTSAGTIMKLKGVPETRPDGKTVYRVEGLRSQGVEVVGEPFADYHDFQSAILNDINTGNMNDMLQSFIGYAKGKGYTSVVRAFLQNFILLAESFVEDSRFWPTDHSADLTEAEKTALNTLTDDFNRNIAANINLYTYVEPVEGATDTYKYYYTFPSLQCVADWYNGVGENALTAEQQALFKKACAIVRHALTVVKPIGTGEYFTVAEQQQLSSWGYDITAKYGSGEYLLSDGTIYTPFETIFGDADLLFNWIKMDLVKFTDPETAPKTAIYGGLSPYDIAQELQKHMLSKKLVAYLPRLHPDTRYYLISGQLTGTDGVEGSYGNTYEATGQFGFANEAGTAYAGTEGKAAQWVIKRVTTDEGNDFAINTDKWRGNNPTNFYTTFFFDFPVRSLADNDAVKFFLPNANMQTKVITDGSQAYDMFYYQLHEVDVNGIVPMQTPCLVWGNANASHHVQIVQPEDMPSPAAFAPRRADQADDSAPMSGVLLSTSITKSEMSNMAGLKYDDQTGPVYRLQSLAHQAVSGLDETHSLVFHKNDGTLNANEAFLLYGDEHQVPAPTADTGARVNSVFVSVPELNDEPTDEEVLALPDDLVPTGIENVAIDAEGFRADAPVYDLLGRRVAQPLPGSLYIQDGRKFIAK